MGDLSKNFSRAEFACKGDNCCGHSAPVHPLLVKGLQELRDLLHRPLIITSGFRCVKHNSEIQGVSDSYHCLAMAADITCGYVDSKELSNLAETILIFRHGGIGVYPEWVHLDVRGSAVSRPARWEVI